MGNLHLGFDFATPKRMKLEEEAQKRAEHRAFKQWQKQQDEITSRRIKEENRLRQKAVKGLSTIMSPEMAVKAVDLAEAAGTINLARQAWKNVGAYPYAEKEGKTEAKAKVAGNKADRAESRVSRQTSKAISPFVKSITQSQALERVSGSKLNALENEAAINAGVPEAEALANVATAKATPLGVTYENRAAEQRIRLLEEEIARMKKMAEQVNRQETLREGFEKMYGIPKGASDILSGAAVNGTGFTQGKVDWLRTFNALRELNKNRAGGIPQELNAYSPNTIALPSGLGYVVP